MARTLERETKLSADWDYDPPDLRGVVGATERLPELALQARYFDTADYRLWSRGITLRHRVGEGPPEGTWTVKLPEGSFAGRLERTELSWVGARGTFPPEGMHLLRGIIRRAPLTQLTQLDTTRRRLLLKDHSGPAWGELDDDIVRVVGGPRDGLRFRQLEVELEPGPPEVAAAALGALRQAGARPSTAPKLAVALGWSTKPARRDRPGQKPVVGDLVRSSLVQGLDRLLDCDYRLRLRPDDPGVGDIHQARVATRRLRSNLKLFASLLDGVWLRQTRAELRWLGEALGRVRDCDVLVAHFDPHGGGTPDEVEGRSEMRLRLGDQRRAAAAELRDDLDGQRYVNLLDRLHAGAQRPPFHGTGPGPDTPARRALPSLVGAQRRALRRQVRRGGRHPTDAHLHRTRIRAKAVRYAAEVAVPVVGKPARRTARAAEALQTVLGAQHDAVVAEAWLRRQASEGPPAASFQAGLLVAEQRRNQERGRRQWRPVAARLDRKQTRRWLA